MSNTLLGMATTEAHRLDVRRARLFLCACVRRMEGAGAGSFRAAVELAERYAEGRAGLDEVRSMRYTYRYHFTHPAAILLAPGDRGPADMVERGLIFLEAFDRSDAEHSARLALWRDLFDGPGVRFDPAWRTWDGGTVRRLAEAIAAGDFDQMPILGDALEDAGCTDDAILAHCRGGGLHARGCWVLERLRG